jgi:hypothetical protein
MDYVNKHVEQTMTLNHVYVIQLVYFSVVVFDVITAAQGRSYSPVIEAAIFFHVGGSLPGYLTSHSKRH